MGPVHWDDAEEDRFGRDPLRGRFADLGSLAGSVDVGLGRLAARDLGRAAGSVRAGLNHLVIAPGREGWPVLDGAGRCLLRFRLSDALDSWDGEPE